MVASSMCLTSDRKVHAFVSAARLLFDNLVTSTFQTGVLPHQPRTGEGTDAQAPAGRCSLNHLGLFGKLKRQLNHVRSCLGLFVTLQAINKLFAPPEYNEAA